jgi:GH24 family phage-related lysozyme (muramidase)
VKGKTLNNSLNIDEAPNALREAYLPIAIGWEGELRTIYRDTLGNATVGDGLLLPSMASALVLPFQVAGRAATADEIAHEYDRVMAIPMGLRADKYANASSPTLSIAECTDLLRTVVASRIADLTRLLPRYAGLSFAWRLALLDMAYNLGTHGLLIKFPHLVLGVEAGSSSECMAECGRPQLSAARNNWTRTQFASASGLSL